MSVLDEYREAMSEDVADPERDRNTWRVIDEGRGIDLVLEFRNMGKKHKDLVENVQDYARLGITECFSFVVSRNRLTTL